MFRSVLINFNESKDLTDFPISRTAEIVFFSKLPIKYIIIYSLRQHFISDGNIMMIYYNCKYFVWNSFAIWKKLTANDSIGITLKVGKLFLNCLQISPFSSHWKAKINISLQFIALFSHLCLTIGCTMK